METKQIAGSDLTVNINNIIISYDDRGNGKVPVIFIHGFPFDKKMWHPQMQFLSKSNRTIAYDIRGYGGSDAGKQNVSIGLFADDLINFMDALEISKAIVCGLSMGGYILMNAASIYPQRFEAIILSDTQCIPDSPEAKEARTKLISRIADGNIPEFTDSWINKIFTSESLEHKPDIVRQVRETILSTSKETLIGTLKALAERPDLCAHLSNISIPALIVCGEDDIVTPPVQSEYLFRHIANAKMQLIKGAGHLSNLEQPDEFNRRVFDFISGLSE